MKDLKFYDYDCAENEELTLDRWLDTLLLVFWQEGEGFSGKRPFGNSGWRYPVYEAMAKAGIIEATWTKYEDDDCADELEEFDQAKADNLILEHIKQRLEADK